jgi:hypothetical protein
MFTGGFDIITITVVLCWGRRGYECRSGRNSLNWWQSSELAAGGRVGGMLFLDPWQSPEDTD